MRQKGKIILNPHFRVLLFDFSGQSNQIRVILNYVISKTTIKIDSSYICV